MARKASAPTNPVHARFRALKRKLRRTRLVVALLGAGGQGLSERRRIASALARQGVQTVVPEDDFPGEEAPSLLEEEVFSGDSVDLVFVNVESWGSAAEFAQLRANPRIAPKLRVLVSPAHHPLFEGGSGYLTDLYLSHLAEYGHVYAVDGEIPARPRSALAVVGRLSARHRRVKALRSGLPTKDYYT